jgi:hypothetical protein
MNGYLRMPLSKLLPLLLIAFIYWSLTAPNSRADLGFHPRLISHSPVAIGDHNIYAVADDAKTIVRRELRSADAWSPVPIVQPFRRVSGIAYSDGSLYIVDQELAAIPATELTGTHLKLSDLRAQNKMLSVISLQEVHAHAEQATTMASVPVDETKLSPSQIVWPQSSFPGWVQGFRQ